MSRRKTKLIEDVYREETKLNIPVVNRDVEINQVIPNFKPVSAKTPNQKIYIKEILSKIITVGIGAAGCGKSFLSMGVGIERVVKGEFNKIIVTRPVIEACGEKLGYLPGSYEEKLDPYLRALWDIIDEILPLSEAKKFKAENIEVCPIAYMRGRTLRNKYIIADECQNMNWDQLKLIITRLGENSKLVLNGDPQQSDLHNNNKGSLERLAHLIEDDPDVGVVHFDKTDIVRHPIIGRILEKIEGDERPRRLEGNYMRNGVSIYDNHWGNEWELYE